MVADRGDVMVAFWRQRNGEGSAGWWRVAFACLVLTLLAARALAADAVPEEKRVALVIGISKYQFAPQLPNPDNDARRISEALRRVKFEVDELYDPDYRTLSRSLRAFGLKAQKADAALVFYAGHGVQLEREHDLLYEALSLDLFLGEISQAKKVGILLLDACRNNPSSSACRAPIPS